MRQLNRMAQVAPHHIVSDLSLTIHGDGHLIEAEVVVGEMHGRLLFDRHSHSAICDRAPCTCM